MNIGKSMRAHDFLVGAVWCEDKSRKGKNCKSHEGRILLWQLDRWQKCLVDNFFLNAVT